MGKEDLQDIDHSSQASVWNSLPGDSLDFLSGPLHRGFLARILSGFRVLFIFWPRFVFPARFIACAKYAGRLPAGTACQTTLCLGRSPGSEGDGAGVQA